MKSILLVNFDFPPNYGIGGRRWAKLAKGMAMQDVHIDVIKADPISTAKISPWQSDTLSEKINIHSLPRPVLSEWISHPHKSIVGKIKYRLALSITKLLLLFLRLLKYSSRIFSFINFIFLYLVIQALKSYYNTIQL